MSWEATRRLFSLHRPQATKVGGFVQQPARKPTALGAIPGSRSLCVVSGKGGTGKSLIAASLASLLARRANTLLFDADLGVGNAHILQGVSPRATVADVLSKRIALEQALQLCRKDLYLLAGGSGLAHLAHLGSGEIDHLASGFRSVENRFEFLVVDSAAGLSAQTLAFAAACELVLVVTTPAVTALTDAYAFMKVLWSRCPTTQVRIVVNRVMEEAQGREAVERLCAVTQRFLGQSPSCIALLPEHASAFLATQERKPLVDGGRENGLAVALQRLEEAVLAEWRLRARHSFAEKLGEHLFA